MTLGEAVRISEKTGQRFRHGREGEWYSVMWFHRYPEEKHFRRDRRVSLEELVSLRWEVEDE